MLTIALADDHASTLLRFKTFFKQFPQYSIIAEASNGYNLILKLNQLKQLPDIILMDIHMPVVDGIAAAYYIKHKYPAIKIISLTNYDTEEMIKQSIYSKSDGFVMKASAESILLKSLLYNSNNCFYFDERVILSEEQKNNLQKFREKIFENENILTKREKEFIILNAMPLSYDQIAQLMFVEKDTIQTYFNRIAKKYNIHTRHELLLFSLQNGLARTANFIIA